MPTGIYEHKIGLNGYKVVRFWEHEINKSVENCISKIILEDEASK